MLEIFFRYLERVTGCSFRGTAIGKLAESRTV
jgi:hypothetical protein